MANGKSPAQRLNTHYIALAVIAVGVVFGYMIGIPALVMSSRNTHLISGIQDDINRLENRVGASTCEVTDFTPVFGTPVGLTVDSVYEAYTKECGDAVAVHVTLLLATSSGGNDVLPITLPIESGEFNATVPIGRCSTVQPNAVGSVTQTSATVAQCTLDTTGGADTVGIDFWYRKAE